MLLINGKKSSMKEKSLLIIGGAGYIGTVVVNFFLKQKYKVTSIDNLLYGQKNNIKIFNNNKNFSFFNIDLRDKKKNWENSY